MDQPKQLHELDTSTEDYVDQPAESEPITEIAPAAEASRAELTERSRPEEVREHIGAAEADPLKYGTDAGFDEADLHKLKHDKLLPALAGAIDPHGDHPGNHTSEHMLHQTSGELVNLAHQMNIRRHERGEAVVGVDEAGHVRLDPADLKEVAGLLYGPMQEAGDDNVRQSREAAEYLRELAADPALGQDARLFAEEKALAVADMADQLGRMAEQAPPPDEEPVEGAAVVSMEDQLAARELRFRQYLKLEATDLSEYPDSDRQLSRLKADRLAELAGTIHLLPELKDGPNDAYDSDMLAHDEDIDRLTTDIINITRLQDRRNNLEVPGQPVRAHRADITHVYDEIAEDRASLTSLQALHERLQHDAASDADGRRSAETVELNQAKVSVLADILARRDPESGGAQQAA